MNSESNVRNIFVVRHGERVDMCFGYDWIEKCYGGNPQKYHRTNLNMPKQLRPRLNGIESYRNDTPLTELGKYQARLLGESFRSVNDNLSFVYSSCSFRCVETAHHFLEGYGKDLPIRVEPGSFEWLVYWKNFMPEFATPEELSLLGFNIDLTYTPVYTLERLKSQANENLKEYYDRCCFVTDSFVLQNEANIILFAHAGSADSHLGRLAGYDKNISPTHNFRDIPEFTKVVPYCGIYGVKQSDSGGWTEMEDFPDLFFTCESIKRTKKKPFGWIKDA